VADGRGRNWVRARRAFESPAAAETPAAVTEVVCPGCFRRTDRVHMFEAPVVVCGVVFLAWTYETIAGCPRCVRRRLWRRLVVSVPFANLAFPAVAPFLLWDLFLSHWDDGPHIPPEYHGWAALTPPPPDPPGRRPRRVLAALAAVVVAAAVLFLILPRVFR
jgi:hypothetical protein